MPADQKRKQQTGRLDAQRKALDRRLAVYPIDIEEDVADGQGERHRRQLRAEAECNGSGAGDSRIELSAQIESDLGGQHVDQDQREQHDHPARQREAPVPRRDLTGRVEAAQRTAVGRCDGMLFVSECHG